MFNWLRRRRLSDKARKQLLIIAARSEEAIIETHVANLIDLLTSLREEVDLDRGLELYTEMLGLDEATATTVTNRLLARLGNPRNAREGRRFQTGVREEHRP
jgi:hypothetical protein